MLPVVCRCCGAAIEVRAADNPNVCRACANAEANFEGAEPEVLVSTGTLPPAIAPNAAIEAEQFLEIEGPTVLECFDAAEQAKRAIAESLAEEQALKASKSRAA